MTSILLDECGDWAITEGRTTIVTGADNVRQRWLVYIRTSLGEWFLDQNIGVPYTQVAFAKQISRQTLKQVFSAATLQVPGILQVASVVINDLNTATREADITVTCIIDGAEGPETGVFQYTGAIPPQGCPTDEQLVVFGDVVVFYGNQIVIN